VFIAATVFDGFRRRLIGAALENFKTKLFPQLTAAQLKAAFDRGNG